MSGSLVQQPDELILRSCLEHSLGRMSSTPPTVVSLNSTPYQPDVDHSYPISTVTVALSHGAGLTLSLKDLSTSRRPKDHIEDRRERELWIYRDLLAQGGLGTATYYGSVWDHSIGRYWLLLEFVPGQLMSQHPFPVWQAAAGWLGRMQGFFAATISQAQASPFLLRYDAAFFASTAMAAQDALAQISDDYGKRLATVFENYDRVVDVIASQPTTLVHSAFKATQILVDTQVDPPRICPIDWEQAAIGPTLYDLAFLSDDFEPEQCEQLWDAYRIEAQNHHVAVPDHDHLTYVVDCLRLHRVMSTLSKSVIRAYAPKKVRKLVERAERLGRLVA